MAVVLGLRTVHHTLPLSRILSDLRVASRRKRHFLNRGFRCHFLGFRLQARWLLACVVVCGFAGSAGARGLWGKARLDGDIRNVHGPALQGRQPCRPLPSRMDPRTHEPLSKFWCAIAGCFSHKSDAIIST